MKFMQLGNGTGLDIDKVSSSFLFRSCKGEFLLFDCGYNVVRKLIVLDIPLENIKYIFISHIHEDHIGNLLLLIYKRFFEHNKVTTIITGNLQTYDFLKGYLEQTALNRLVGCALKDEKMFDLKLLEYKESFGDFVVKVIKNTNHLVVESSGMMIYEDDEDYPVIITGDTKATSYLESEINSLLKIKEDDCIYVFSTSSNSNAIIFHDFSHFNHPSRNPHACENDMQIEYSEKFRSGLNFYHTGEDTFCSEWVDVGDTKSVYKSGLKLYNRLKGGFRFIK